MEQCSSGGMADTFGLKPNELCSYGFESHLEHHFSANLLESIVIGLGLWVKGRATMIKLKIVDENTGLDVVIRWLPQDSPIPMVGDIINRLKTDGKLYTVVKREFIVADQTKDGLNYALDRIILIVVPRSSI